MIPVTRLWLVDDDPIFVYLTRKMIAKMNFKGNIDVFANGQLAIDHLRQLCEKDGDVPQVIFLDLMMPVLDGWGFLDEYLEIAESHRKNITIYILSSSDSPQDIKRAKKYPEVRRFITKPISEDKFSEIVGGIETRVY